MQCCLVSYLEKLLRGGGGGGKAPEDGGLESEADAGRRNEKLVVEVGGGPRPWMGGDETGAPISPATSNRFPMP